MVVACYKCGSATTFHGTLGFREECLQCGEDLHVCKNCQHYDLKAYNECREPAADRIREKERSNFCEFFLAQNSGVGTLNDSKSDLLNAAEALFKKKKLIEEPFMAKTSHSEIFHCSPEQFYKLVIDFERYPEFIDEVKSVKILKTEGNTRLIEYQISVIKTISYTLETVEKSKTEVSWNLIRGDIFKKLSGSWLLAAEGENCRAVYTVDIDFGIFVPGPIVKTLQSVNLKSMMSAFQKRVKDVYGR